MFACTKCGQANSPGQRFCSNCGAALTPPAPVASMWRCTFCGQSNESNIRFCTECGRPLASQGVAQAQPAAPPAAYPAAYVGTDIAYPPRMPDAMVATPPMAPAAATGLSMKLWSPNLIFGMGFFFGLPSGIVLAAINWRRMQMPNLVRNSLIVLVVFFFSLFLNMPQFVYLAISAGGAFYLRTQMEKSINQYRAAGGVVEAAQWWIGLLISLGVLVVLFILIVLVAIITSL